MSKYTIRVDDDGPDGLRGEVLELPGCRATGDDEGELYEALRQAIRKHWETRRIRAKPTGWR
jgi:predicted RNase H-like HicB family nuclease